MAKLAIIGTGFVGASLSLALRRSKLFEVISGYDRDRTRLAAAKRIGAVDQEAPSSAAAVQQAAVVVLTVPGRELLSAFDELAPGLSPGAVVTETSRWKVPATEAARTLPPEVHFIAGRPVLDDRGHDAEEARAEVFRNAIYCLSPEQAASEAAVNAMSALVTAAGAQPYFLDPAEHDGLTAAGELLPPALLAVTISALTSHPRWDEAGKLAGDTFNQLAQLAEDAGPALWQEAAQNSAALARWLDTTAAALLDLRDRLNDSDQIEADWQATLQALARWRRDKRLLQESTMPPMNELKPNLFGKLLKARASR